MPKQGEKVWPKFEVVYSEVASADEAGRTDVSLNYNLYGSRPRASHSGSVAWNRLDGNGVAGIKAAWASVVAAMGKHGVALNASGSTVLTSVSNEVTHRFYRLLNKAVEQVTKWGEEQSKHAGRSVPKHG